ncbi:DCC1-like thiol-disulfide oxidoreductase family protein [bacterium]|nr:DCC1-like thiol-disulfide oxidoreductase family protein [bacterium]
MASVEPIVFYDGHCGLCNRTVATLARWDRKQRLYFAPLQGETAAQNLATSLTQDVGTVIFFQNGRPFLRSQAAVEILKAMGGVKWIAGCLLQIVPTFLRDAVYLWIAQRRKIVFGTGKCPFPQGSASRFLP